MIKHTISPFLCARPVWPVGRAELLNDFVLFRGAFTALANSQCLLRMTGSTQYRVKLNGEFIAWGPARGPAGMFRVDEIPLTAAVGENALEIEVSGSNVNCYFYMKHPSFLQAEVVVDNKPVTWTGADITAWDLSGQRIRKCSRYSFQRMFSEVYRVSPLRGELPSLALEEQSAVRYLPRRVPYLDYKIDDSFHVVSTGHRRFDTEKIPVPYNRFVDDIGQRGILGFPVDELDYNLWKLLRCFPVDESGDIATTTWGGRLNNTGFLHAKVHCTVPGRLYVMFAELQEADGHVNPCRLGTCDGIVWELAEPGDYELETMEPYTCMYMETFMDGGAAEVQSVSIREVKSPWAWNYEFKTDDAELAAIFEAGRESFAANAVDCFTDCPSRERGGWLCDSFLIARSSFLHTGDARLEQVFLENFALAPDFPGLPDGAIAMTYPGDHPDGVFIPNWCMWLVLQVEEYVQRSGDRAMLAMFKPRLMAFIRYMDTFVNADGLLEKLPSWVFVEWSKSNSFVQDVNYPSNMTYASVLEAMGRMYEIPGYAERAKAMRDTICKQSWNGQWFCDHAIRQTDGTLLVQPDDITETCQYYAFFFKTATADSHPGLWKRLLTEFGPHRAEQGIWPEIWPSNSFIGNYLRLELLSLAGLHAQLLDECKGYFLKMARQTGTLWENSDTRASCCHGFASYINVMLARSMQAQA